MDLKLDVKAKVDEIVKKIQSDPEMLKNFGEEPVKTIEKLVGVDLPEDKIQPIVAGVSAKLALSDVGDKLNGLKKFF